MVELYIEDKLVDLSGDEDIAIDYSIAKIGEIQKRSGGISIRFNIPKTSNNRSIIGNIDDINSTTLNPYRKLKARLYVNGVDIRIRFATIEVVKDKYGIRLYDSQSDFYSIISGHQISELDICSYNHFWTLTEVVSSRLNTSNYIYPIINYHSDAPNSVIDNSSREIDIKYMHPALFYDELLSNISEWAGYSLVNKLLEDNTYIQNKLLLAYSGDNLVRSKVGSWYKGRLNVDTDQNTVYSFDNATVTFDSHTSDCNWYDGLHSYDVSEIKLQDVVNVSGNAHIIIEWAGAPFTMRIEIGNLWNNFISDTVTVNTGVNTYDYSFTGENGSDDSQNSIYLLFKDLPVSHPVFTIKEGTYWEITECEVIEPLPIYYANIGTDYSDYITTNSLFGEFKMDEAFKNYLMLFCGFLNVEDYGKTVEIFTFKDVIKNISKAKDWSDKRDFTDEPDIYFASDYAQVNRLIYKENSDEQKPFDSDSSIIIDDENLEGEKDFIQLAFSATNKDELLDGLDINTIPCYKDLELTSNANYRVLLLDKKDSADLTPTGDITYTDSVATSVISTDMPFTRFIDINQEYNLGFGNSIASNFYSDFSDTLSKMKVVNVRYKLNESDINNLDFRIPVYDKHFNAYFYISQIKAYTPTNNESTMVELVKLF